VNSSTVAQAGVGFSGLLV